MLKPCSHIVTPFCSEKTSVLFFLLLFFFYMAISVYETVCVFDHTLWICMPGEDIHD